MPEDNNQINEENQDNGAPAVQPAQAQAVQGQAAGAAQQNSRWSMVKGFVFRLLIIYFISSLFRRGQNPVPPGTTTGGKDGPANPLSNAPGVNIFPKDSFLDMYVYLSESPTFNEFDDPSKLYWHLPRIRYGDWQSGENQDGSYTKIGKISASESLMQNGTLYIHVYFVATGRTPGGNASQSTFSKKHTFHSSKMLTKFKRRKISNTVNLLTGETEGPRLTQEDFKHTDSPLDPSASNSKSQFHYLPPVTHWHPNFTIQLLDDHSPWTRGSIPPPLNEFIEFYDDSNEYYPVIFLNDYWNLHEDYQPVNTTTPTLNLSLTYAPISLFRWQMYTAQTMRNKWYGNILGEGIMQESDEEQDTLKKTLLDTNPYLLAMTVIVSLVHSVFEVLAFKNDIQFWRSRESLEGLSVRSVFFSVFQSLIIVLYVWDHDTNFMVKISVVVGMFIECWKIKKVVNIQVDRENLLLGVIPRIRFLDKSSYVESDTKKYDQMAFRYLSWLLYPLLAVYAVYSLLYQEHRGWYSWVLSMLYGFLLTFGFIMMTPQLFINYKLKSVAHLPWRMLTYKALNTFIDDIFAFVIRMPTLYRIGCLRDDVIFFIFLYQRWIYPIDPRRVNEYGVSQEMLEKRKRGELPTTSEANGAPLPVEGDNVPEGDVAGVTEDAETKKTK